MLWEHIFAFTKWFQYHCNCGPSISQLQWLGEEEARKNWDAIIAKCRTAHANMAKLQLKASEISMGTGVSESHKSVLAKNRSLQYDSHNESRRLCPHHYNARHPRNPTTNNDGTPEGKN